MINTLKPAEGIDLIIQKLTEQKAQATQLLEMEQTQRQKVQKLKADKEEIDQALTLMRLAMKEQVNVKERLEEFATFLLQATFGPDFHFGFEVVENKSGMVTGLAPRITRHGIARSASRNGGGAANMSATGLRFALQSLHDILDEAPITILDEPAANLDQEKWPEFLQSLIQFAELTGRQVFLITHTGHGFPCKIKTSMPRQASKAVLVSESAM